MFCQLFDGLTMRKKTKGYRQKIRNGRMTICGTSTGVLLPAVLHDLLRHVMTDGVVARCLFMVLTYRNYLHQQHADPDLSMPSIAQMLLAIAVLGSRQFLFTKEAQNLLDNYIENLSKQANESTTPFVTSLLAKQPIQVTRMTALVKMLDILPIVFQHIEM